MFRSKRALWAVLILATIFSPAWAEEKEKIPPTKEPTTADVTRWIKQLEIDREAFPRNKFDSTSSKRNAAEKKILSAGQAAIPALSRAAMGDNLERTANSIVILGKFLKSGDDDLSASAKEALENIASGQNEMAAIRAKAELERERLETQQMKMNPQDFVEFNEGANVFCYRSGNRLLMIDRRGEGGLLVSLSDRVRGVFLPKVYKAKNTEEFKERYPAIYDLYKKAMLVAKDSTMKPQAMEKGQAMAAKLKKSVNLPARERRKAEPIEDLEIVDESLRSMNEVLTREEAASSTKTDLRLSIIDLQVQLELMENRLDLKFDKREPKAETAEIAPGGEVAEEDIARWVEQLGSVDYGVWQAARKKLVLAGEKAIPALSKAAAGKSSKTSARSIGVFQRFLQSADKDLQSAARDSLRDIVVGDNPLAAQFATHALNGKAEGEPFAAPGEKEGGIQITFLPGKFYISDTRQIIAKGGGNWGLEITVLDKEAGRFVHRVIKVKDMEEFEEKYPEVFRDYRKAAQDEIRERASYETHFNLVVHSQHGMIKGLNWLLGPIDQMPERSELVAGLNCIALALKYMNEDLAAEKLAPSTEEKMRVWIEELRKQLDIMEERLAEKADGPRK